MDHRLFGQEAIPDGKTCQQPEQPMHRQQYHTGIGPGKPAVLPPESTQAKRLEHSGNGRQDQIQAKHIKGYGRKQVADQHPAHRPVPAAHS